MLWILFLTQLLKFIYLLLMALNLVLYHFLVHANFNLYLNILTYTPMWKSALVKKDIVDKKSSTYL